MVALEGVENILRVGKIDAQDDPQHINSFADLVEQCKGLDFLEALQQHENEDIYRKAMLILQTYFEQDEDDGSAGPQTQTEAGGTQFTFGQAPQGGNTGFSF